MKQNPFASQRTAPENCTFIPLARLLPDDHAAAMFIYRAMNLLDRYGTAQIVGPHGCGKSTLALWISKHLPHRFAGVRSVVVRRGEDVMTKTLFPPLTVNVWEVSLPPDANDNRSADDTTGRELLIVDGIENLTFMNRMLMMKNVKRRDTDVLVTTHRKMLDLPVVANLKPDLNHFRQIVNHLLADEEVVLKPNLVDATFEQCGGDYRAALWKLYDHFESATNADAHSMT